MKKPLLFTQLMFLLLFAFSQKPTVELSQQYPQKTKLPLIPRATYELEGNNLYVDVLDPDSVFTLHGEQFHQYRFILRPSDSLIMAHGGIYIGLTFEDAFAVQFDYSLKLGSPQFQQVMQPRSDYWLWNTDSVVQVITYLHPTTLNASVTTVNYLYKP